MATGVLLQGLVWWNMFAVFPAVVFWGSLIGHHQGLFGSIGTELFRSGLQASSGEALSCDDRFRFFFDVLKYNTQL